MNKQLETLIRRLTDLLKTAPEISLDGQRLLLTFLSVTNNTPLKITIAPGEDFKLVYGKTPHYYIHDAAGMEHMLSDIRKWCNGETVLISYCDRNGKAADKDRICTPEAANIKNLDELETLLRKINLMHSDDCEDLLAGNGKILVKHFDSQKDYDYTRKGKELIRE